MPARRRPNSARRLSIVNIRAKSATDVWALMPCETLVVLKNGSERKSPPRLRKLTAAAVSAARRWCSAIDSNQHHRQQNQPCGEAASLINHRHYQLVGSGLCRPGRHAHPGDKSAAAPGARRRSCDRHVIGRMNRAMMRKSSIISVIRSRHVAYYARNKMRELRRGYVAAENGGESIEAYRPRMVRAK